MDTVLYDGSYEGLFTAFFEVYEYKLSDAQIFVEGHADVSLFGKVHIAVTDKSKSLRVYKKLEEKVSRKAMQQMYKSYLSGERYIENVMLHYIQYVIASKNSVETNYGHPDVLYLQQLSRKVDREKHRMEAFIRFQLTKDQLYFAIIQPDYNVIPLISNHFEKRYADQRWFIYDSRRKYGIYYNLETVEEVEMTFAADHQNPNSIALVCEENEELYQKLWQQYFTSINIAARKNMKLHIQHMPKRYWRFLTEKKPM